MILNFFILENERKNNIYDSVQGMREIFSQFK
jgi:hypothetical protein